MVEQRKKGCGYVLISADFNGAIKVFINKTKPKHSSLPYTAILDWESKHKFTDQHYLLSIPTSNSKFLLNLKEIPFWLLVTFFFSKFVSF